MSDKICYGFVVDNNDPLKIGRCKVKIIGKYDSLKDSELPWVQILLPCNTLESPVGPPIGSQVMLITLDENFQQFLIVGVIPGITQTTHDTADFIRNDSTPSIVSIKESNNISGVEPSATSNYNTSYPYNRGLQSLSGHVIEIDDTPSKERIDIFHKSGSYLEFTNNSTILKSVEDYYQINSGNFIGYIGSDYELTIKGSSTISCESNYNLTVSSIFNATSPIFNFNGTVNVNGGLYFTQAFCYGGGSGVKFNTNLELESDKILKSNTISSTSGGTTNISNNLNVSGNITATGYVVGSNISYSDIRLKTKLNKIENALEKVLCLEGFIYKPNEKGLELGIKEENSVGISAQDLEKVLPELVRPSAYKDYLTVEYDKLTALLIEAIKDLYNIIKAS